MRKHLSTIILGIVLLAGLSLLLYPTISDYWNSYHQSKAIAGYVQAVDNLDDEKRQKMLEAQRREINAFAGDGICDYIEVHKR